MELKQDEKYFDETCMFSSELDKYNILQIILHYLKDKPIFHTLDLTATIS